MKFVGKAYQIQLMLDELIAKYGTDAKMTDVVKGQGYLWAR